MIDHLGVGRLFVLLVVALIVFGPDRLPEIAAQAGRALRQFKQMVSSMGSEVRTSLGPELADLDLKSLHPRAFLSNLMADETPGDAVPATPTPMATRPLFAAPVGSDAMALLHAPIDLEAGILLEKVGAEGHLAV